MSETQYSETWVEAGDGRCLCGLVNGELGWLLYLRAAEDAGFSSRNLAYSGPGDAMLNYCLDNGQMDEYPLEWALPVEEIQRALDYFRQEQRPPPFIVWHNDAGDGTDIEAAWDTP